MNIIIGIFIFILGTCFASFFGVVIDRVPLNKSIINPSSHCNNCGHILKWYENIPILSYIFLKGRCSKCKEKIGIFSLILEIVGGSCPLIIFIMYGISIESILLMIISLVLVLMAFYDYKTLTILDFMWIVYGILILIVFSYRVFILKDNYLEYLLSFVISLLFFVLLKLFGYLLTKQDVLGNGDIIVFSLSCLLFNPLGILISLVIGCVPGSIIELIKLKINKNKDTSLPFLPYLNLGVYVAILFTSKLILF